MEKLGPLLPSDGKWLITWYENGGGPFATEILNYRQAKDWLLGNGDVPNFQPVYIYKGTADGLKVHSIKSFLEAEQ